MPLKKKPGQANRERPTIREVAKLAGVGLMTVSRVINDHPAVRPKTKRKVMAAIEELGYERNEAAGLLKGHRAMMIGLIVPDLSDVFFAACANTIERIARENGYLTLIVSSGHDPELEVQQAELMSRRKLAGLLCVTSGKADPARFQKMIEGGLPIVAFDRPLDGVQTDSVLFENRSGAEEAVEHLIGHGHKRIACMSGESDAYPIKERVRGYSHAMLSHSLKTDIFSGVDSLESAVALIEQFAGAKSGPTALFSTSYRTTVLVLMALAQKKIQIPKQMALIGFEDFDLAPVVAPPITTVGQSAVDLAKRAFRLLMDRMARLEDRAGSHPEKVLLPASLIVRQSCGAHPLD